jgi:hypothetical protein
MIRAIVYEAQRINIVLRGRIANDSYVEKEHKATANLFCG